ncbi:MAG: sigma-70 family RNA polymerase sigma factor [Gemmataceae bacterium]|nr:sigma-70 family RNA polymerase sigma factor [Gemmataceae bacterium]
MQATDATLVSDCLRGDRSAFAAIVERYQGMACAVAYSRLGDLAASEDAAQQAFLVAWRNLSLLREPDKLRAWLAGIVRNTARSEGRHTSPEPLSLEPVAAQTSPEDEAARREEAAIIWESLGRLPEQYREPLVLYYREHQSVSEVAEAMELSQDAVKQRLARGRDMLRESLTGRIEAALRQTGPKAAFTAGVLAALDAGAGTATAAGGLAVGGVAPFISSAALGVAGGVAGSVLGVAGGAFGTAMSIRNTKTPAERAFMVKCAWWTWILVTLWTGLYLYVSFFEYWLFTSPWFQIAFWGIHTVCLVTGITYVNKRAARLRGPENT